MLRDIREEDIDYIVKTTINFTLRNGPLFESVEPKDRLELQKRVFRLFQEMRTEAWRRHYTHITEGVNPTGLQNNEGTD